MEKEKKLPTKIHIVGIYGSGKSTLAKKLSDLLNIRAYDLDEIKYKRKYDLIRSVGKRLEIIRKISNKKQWITEGAWLDYAKALYKKADLVIFLEIPKQKLYFRILLRHFKRKFYNKKYKGHNLKSTFKILGKVKQYYHDPNHFMTLDSHKKYILENAKKFTIIKNNRDIRKLIKILK